MSIGVRYNACFWVWVSNVHLDSLPCAAFHFHSYSEQERMEVPTHLAHRKRKSGLPLCSSRVDMPIRSGDEYLSLYLMKIRLSLLLYSSILALDCEIGLGWGRKGKRHYL